MKPCLGCAMRLPGLHFKRPWGAPVYHVHGLMCLSSPSYALLPMALPFCHCTATHPGRSVSCHIDRLPVPFPPSYPPAPPAAARAVRVALRLPLGSSAVVAARMQHALLTLLGQDGVAALPAGPASVVGSAPITHSASQLLWSPCAGLNDTRILAGLFQEPQGHNALAATADGRLVVLAVGGNGGRKGCQVGVWAGTGARAN